MPDTWDTWQATPASVPPLTAAIIAAMPKTAFGTTVGPVATDKSLRSLLDALAGMEAKQIAHGW
jgi:hypothetical protein